MLILFIVCVRILFQNTINFTMTGKFVYQIIEYTCWYWKIFLTMNWFEKKNKEMNFSIMHSRKMKHHFSKSETATKFMIQIDQQTQTKTVSRIVILISTRIIIHFFSTFDILKISMKRTIISNYVKVTQQIKKTSVSKSHWFIIFNHWILTNRFKNHFNWISIVFHITILSVKSTNHAIVCDFISITSSRVCKCVSQVNLETSFL